MKKTIGQVAAVAAVVIAAVLPLLAAMFHDRSYIVILSPLSFAGALLLLVAILLRRRWLLVLTLPFFAVPFLPW